MQDRRLIAGTTVPHRRERHRPQFSASALFDAWRLSKSTQFVYCVATLFSTTFFRARLLKY